MITDSYQYQVSWKINENTSLSDEISMDFLYCHSRLGFSLPDTYMCVCVFKQNSMGELQKKIFNMLYIIKNDKHRNV